MSSRNCFVDVSIQGRLAKVLSSSKKNIRPVSVERCYKFTALKKVGILRAREELLQEATTDRDRSGRRGKERLIEAIRYENEDLQMPPGKS